MGNIITFGELLLRLAAPGYTKLFQTDQLQSTFCGAEANVAVSLTNFGVPVSFITVLPNNDIGTAAARSLQYFSVDTSKIIYSSEGRMGLYYLEKGASQRPSKVIYDREGSAFAKAFSKSVESNFNWNEIFDGASWFHWSGINPALSPALQSITEQACKVAKEKGLKISCDLNYRSKLWTPGEAQTAMKKLVPYVDICICNEEDAEKALGLSSPNSNIEDGKLNKKDYIQIAEEICKEYGCKYVATTFRKSYSASVNGWSAMLYSVDNEHSRTAHFSPEYKIQLVDRVGGGDSFAAGLIYGFVSGMNNQDIVDFAVAASCLKQTIEGDFNRVSVDDVKGLLRSGGSGRVQR